MRNRGFIKMAFVLAIVFCSLANTALAQTQSRISGVIAPPERIDGGAIVTEESTLTLQNKKHAKFVFVAAVDFQNNTTISWKTTDSDGSINSYGPVLLPQGLQKGQSIELWNGDFNIFQFGKRFDLKVTLRPGNNLYVTQTSIWIGIPEDNKGLFISNITEAQQSGDNYLITVKGFFNPNDSTIIIINNNVVIPIANIISVTGDTILFRTNSIPRSQFPTGKYSATIAQGGVSYSLQGRHQ